MNISKFVEYLKKRKGFLADRDAADYLGTTQGQLSKWKNSQKILSEREILNLVDRARNAAVRDRQQGTIRPIVEFFPLDAVESRSGKKSELFLRQGCESPLSRAARNPRKDQRDLRLLRHARSGIICGQGTSAVSLGRIKSTFNRERNTQQVFRVDHPKRNQTFQTAEQQPRTIKRTQVQLAEMAAYVSRL